jgi:hypothetical protein
MIVVSVGRCLACGHGGTLYDGRCNRCRAPRSSNGQDACPKVAAAAPRSIHALMCALVAQLEADEIPAPLAQRFTLGHIWHDLALLAGEPVPAHIAAMLDEPTHTGPLLAQPGETHRELAYEPA